MVMIDGDFGELTHFRKDVSECFIVNYLIVAKIDQMQIVKTAELLLEPCYLIATHKQSL